MSYNLIQKTLAVVHEALVAYAAQHDIAITPSQINTALLIDQEKHELGDISTNAALVFAKKLKQNPMSTAAELIAYLKDQKELSTLIDHCHVAAPGFINIRCAHETYVQEGRALFDRAGKKNFVIREITPIKRKRFNIEYVSANPTGPLHVGHGRGGIIGNTLARVLKYTNHPVVEEFYINDAGNQIAKLGESLKIRYLQRVEPEQEHIIPEDGYHGEYLIDLADELISEHHGASFIDKPADFFGSWAVKKVLAQQKNTLAQYGINFDTWFSEKVLHDTGLVQEALDFLEKSGDTYTTEDGALWLASTKYGDDKDRVLRKSTGELTYIASDIAYLKYKKEKGKYDKLVMILGQDHHGYEHRMKAAMQMLGYNPDDLNIIFYQLVSIKESGKQVRLSKRAGKIIALDDIIQTVGVDVARFFYLNKKADAHLEFDIDLACSKTDENPVYYIQYAYVRLASIINKAAAHDQLARIVREDLKELSSQEERIIKKIVELEILLEQISQNYHTHLLAYYATELANLVHGYYTNNRVIDLEHIETSRHRLAFLHILQATLGLCLDLLGVSKPKEM